MIAEQIYKGATKEDLGMSQIEYDSRKATVLDFLQEHEWDAERFLLWLSSRSEGQNMPMRGDDRELPSASEMAKTAARAATQFIGSGFKRVASEEREQRLSTCTLCSEFFSGRCRKCGCYMVLKTWLPLQHCPIGKW